MLERDSSRSINICSAGTHKIERTEEPIDYTSMKIASPFFSTAGFRVIFISNDLRLARVTMRNGRATFGCIIMENELFSVRRHPLPTFSITLDLVFVSCLSGEHDFSPIPYIWLMYTYR